MEDSNARVDDREAGSLEVGKALQAVRADAHVGHPADPSQVGGAELGSQPTGSAADSNAAAVATAVVRPRSEARLATSGERAGHPSEARVRAIVSRAERRLRSNLDERVQSELGQLLSLVPD